MTKSHKIMLGAIAVLSLMSGISPAHADKGGNGRWAQESDNSYIKRSYNNDVRIYKNDKTVLLKYAEDKYQKSCPPGLAKKNKNCMPPGQAKKRYVIGQPLPKNILYYPVPRHVVVQLKPVPTGYQYVSVDNDILLMNQATKMIVDAVTLLASR